MNKVSMSVQKSENLRIYHNPKNFQQKELLCGSYGLENGKENNDYVKKSLN